MNDFPVGTAVALKGEAWTVTEISPGAVSDIYTLQSIAKPFRFCYAGHMDLAEPGEADAQTILDTLE